MKKVQKYVDENVIGPSAIEFVETTGPPKGKSVNIRITEDDTKILSEISFKFKNFFKKSEWGVVGKNDNLSYGKTLRQI